MLVGSSDTQRVEVVMDGVSHDSADAWRQEHDLDPDDTSLRRILIGLLPFIIGALIFAAIIGLSDLAL